MTARAFRSAAQSLADVHEGAATTRLQCALSQCETLGHQPASADTSSGCSRPRRPKIRWSEDRRMSRCAQKALRQFRARQFGSMMTFKTNPTRGECPQWAGFREGVIYQHGSNATTSPLSLSLSKAPLFGQRGRGSFDFAGSRPRLRMSEGGSADSSRLGQRAVRPLPMWPSLPFPFACGGRHPSPALAASAAVGRWAPAFAGDPVGWRWVANGNRERNGQSARVPLPAREG